MPFENTPLPYAFDALEPYIDARTMEIHHDRHLQAYIDGLNRAIAPFPALQNCTAARLAVLNAPALRCIRPALCRNAGGGTVERHGRLASGIANHLDVLHGDAICENARAQRLAHRLFGSKASGVVRSGIGFSVAVILFTLGEHLARERRRTIENAPHAIDFDDIYSQTNGHAGPFYCFEMLLQTAAKNRPLY